MAIKVRKGNIVYATRELTSADLFPGSESVLSVTIKKGTRGKVTDAGDPELPNVKFDGHYEWSINIDDISKRKPK